MNFIIYEDEQKFVEIYKKSIFKLLGPSALNYNIKVISQFDDTTITQIQKIEGNKIFIFDVEVPGKSGIDLARTIRKNGDWKSPIIIISSHEEFEKVGFTSKILMLDFISKKGKIVDTLYNTLLIAIEINSGQTFKFLSHGIMYQLPFQDILFIEKNANDNSSTIFTNNKKYELRSTIQKLELQLQTEIIFLKTHRSYIVNIRNIKHVDFESGVISFSCHKMALLSRQNKKKLKDRMGVIENENGVL